MMSSEKQNPKDEKQEAQKKLNEEREKSHKALEKERRKDYKISMVSRILNLIIGLIFIGTTGYLIFDKTLSENFILTTFAILVALIALGRFISVFYEKNVSGNKRLFNFIVGLILLAIGIFTAADSNLGRQIFVILISIALIIQGVNRILLGIFNDIFPTWYRSITFAVGVIVIGIPVWVIIQNDYNNKDLILLLSYAFFFNGIGRIAKAFSGLKEK